MKMKKLVLLFVFMLNINVYAQLPNGSVAPDFTLTDYYGTTHNLYSYLNTGKTVSKYFILLISLLIGMQVSATHITGRCRTAATRDLY